MRRLNPVTVGSCSMGEGHRPQERSASAAGQFSIVMFGILCMLQGCGSNDVELVDVTGVVMMDGQPLPGATVQFLPIVKADESARPSSAITDQEGEFVLGYSTTKQGARPGNYRVSISTFRHPEPGLPGMEETVPVIYNKGTTLAEEVTAEQRQFYFDLLSDAGEVVQPRH